MKKITMLALAAVLGLTLISCGKYKGFEQLNNGVYYKSMVKGTGEQAKIGDVLVAEITVSINDTVRFSNAGNPDRMLVYDTAKTYNGDLLMEAISLVDVKVGDSVTFIITADDIRGMDNVPEDQPVYDVYYTIKVTGLYNEAAVIEQYIKDNNITVAPNADGMYFIEKTAGNGPVVEQGKTVKVNYVGRLLDGKVFDSSLKGVAEKEGFYSPQREYKPLEFTAGGRQMIPGVDNAVMMMKKGGKATVIIPSKLGYGPQPVQIIPAFSPLIFDLEIVDVK